MYNNQNKLILFCTIIIYASHIYMYIVTLQIYYLAPFNSSKINKLSIGFYRSCFFVRTSVSRRPIARPSTPTGTVSRGHFAQPPGISHKFAAATYQQIVSGNSSIGDYSLPRLTNKVVYGNSPTQNHATHAAMKTITWNPEILNFVIEP